MPEHVVKRTTWLLRLHSACYQFLSARCLRQRRLLYKVRPKTHYLSHMVDFHASTCLCLLHLSTFNDEDFMGKIGKIAQACHGETFVHAWAKRYALKRGLQWSEGENVHCHRLRVCVLKPVFSFILLKNNCFLPLSSLRLMFLEIRL